MGSQKELQLCTVQSDIYTAVSIMRFFGVVYFLKAIT